MMTSDDGLLEYARQAISTYQIGMAEAHAKVGVLEAEVERLRAQLDAADRQIEARTGETAGERLWKERAEQAEALAYALAAAESVNPTASMVTEAAFVAIDALGGDRAEALEMARDAIAVGLTPADHRELLNKWQRGIDT